MKTIKFIADGVKIKSGKADKSADVTFTVGEYMLDMIKDLVAVTDAEIDVEVKVND